MDPMRDDLKAAIRSLGSAKSTTIPALIVLALGIGATTAVFSVVDAVVLRGLPFDEHAAGHFAPLRVNDSLTLDFADSDEFESHHYAFKVSEADFDAMFARIRAEGIPYGSGPPNPFDDMRINHRGGGRGVYFRDLDGHIWEYFWMDPSAHAT